ncbi:M28 family peptidase [Erythrobacter alti]|uniref:M28 family peptidase n=1 Tax=Erythrobacter alti TaxID=1896145 RepID=UPI0030F44FEC
MKNLSLFAALAAFAIASPVAAEDDATSQNPITDRATLESDVRTLADDAMEGREAGTPGYDMAADFVANRFHSLGLQPGGDDGTWFQNFSLVRHSAADDAGLSIVGADGARMKAIYGHDFVGGGLASAGDADGRGRVNAEMVFVGYGLDMPELGHDSFAGVDLQGKVAVWVFDMPEGMDPLLAMHMQQAGADRFAAQGAVGSILLWTPELSLLVNWTRGRNFFGRTSSTTWVGPDGVAHDGAGDMEFQLVASPEMSRQIMAGQAFDMDAIALAQANEMASMPSFEMGARARVSYANQREPLLDTSNVIAIQPGTDPAFADQYVVVSAHLDHVGVEPGHGEDNDRLFNGAMDNASGVATMMEMARLIAAEPTRRPVMFVALGAEEMGLLGSSYHAANPGLTDGHLAVNVNVDMPILTWPFSDVVAFGADRSNIFPQVSAAVGEYDLKLVPDPNPDEGFFFRSDQYSYVQAGIPAVYVDLGFGNGGEAAQEDFLGAHYHQPSDEAFRIDYEQLGRFADIAYLVARNVGNMDDRPAWLAGDFFGDTFGGPVVGQD